MTKDFAKPSTTRKPGDKKKPGPASSAQSKAKKGNSSTKKSNSATLKQNQPRPQSNRTKPVILLILLISAFSYGLYYLQSIPPTKSLPDPALPTMIQKETNIKTPVTNNKQDTRFKFYDLLPESNIKPSEVDAYKFRAKDKQSTYSYLVQTGSFRNKKDAERQKATIAFKGIKADIKIVTGKNDQAWYRVMTGPYNNRSKMNDVLDKLVSINIQPLVKKVKK